MISIPTLNDLAARPEQAADLPPHVAAMLLAQMASLQTVLLGRLFTGMTPDSRREEGTEDRLLLVDEAASMLGMTRDYLYRHADQLPFTVRPAPKQLRFSKLGIQRYIRNRQGK
ncbi:MAG: hypothetical protein LKG23_01115 [Nitrospira sp.]|jgi:predicted DNA-binding transcriptional regulator AlpA|nr:hypothetical protein [Nitrospira sp.]